MSSSPSLPLLPSHRDQPVEQLISERHRRHTPRLPVPPHNLQRVRDLALERPPDHQLRFPPEPAYLFELAYVADRHAPCRVQVLALLDADLLDRAVRRESDAGDRGLRHDVDVTLVALVPRLELYRARSKVSVARGDGAEAVFCVRGAGLGLEPISTQRGADSAASRGLEEAEDACALFAMLRVLGGVDVGTARLVRNRGVVRHGGVEFFGGGVEGGLGAGSAEVLIGDFSRLLGRRGVSVGRRGDRGFVGLADTKEGKGQLGVRGDALQDGAARSVSGGEL